MKYLFTLLLLFLGLNLHAQLFFSAGNTATDVGRDIVRNNAGETFLASTISGNADVNFDPKGSTPVNLRSNGASSDIVIAKYNTSGLLAWKIQIGNVGEEVVSAITLDNSGAVYIVGHYRGNVQFDPQTGLGLLMSNGQREGFIAKYNQSNGGFLWAVSIGDLGNDEIMDIDTDNNSNVYVAGTFEQTVDFEPQDGPGGNDTHTSLGARDFFVAQYDAFVGSLNWVIPIGSSEDDPGLRGGIAVKTDQLGRVNVAGTYRLSVDFDPGPNNNILVSLGEEDIFIAQYSDSGNLNWLRGVGTPNNDFTAPRGIAINLQNRVLMTGSVSGTAERILSYTATDQQDNLRPPTIDNGDVFFGQFDELDGSMIWGNIIGGNSIDFGTSIATDNGNNVYLAANFQGNADADAEITTFPVNSFASGSNFDTFVGQYIDDGSINWAFPLGSGNGENTNLGLWVDVNTGHTLITGRFHLSATFDGMGIPQNQLTSNGDADIYVAEYDIDGILLLPQQNNCPPPKNITVTNIAPRQAVINFEPQLGVGTVTFTINYRPVGSATFISIEGLDTSPELILDLLPNTDYEVCVQSVCDGVPATCSTSQFFKTPAEQTCSAPAFSLQSVTSTSAILGWTPDNLTQYKIQYRKTGQSSFITLPNSNTASPYVILNLQCNTNYEAQIINICGTIESSPSNLVSFKTLNCVTPTCNAPVVSIGTITDFTAVINWSPSDVSFELNYREVGTNTWQTKTGSGNNFLLESLKAGQQYEVRVRNNCPNNVNSDYSFIMTFQTTDSNPCKAPIFGIKNITQTTAEAFWFEEIKKYEISYRRVDPSGDWITFTNIDFKSPFLMQALSAGQTYMVRMRRVCGTDFSEYSDTVMFPTPPVACQRPILTVDQTDHRSVTVSWSPSSGMAELEYHLPSELDWNAINVSDKNNFTVTGLLPGVTYEFRVRNDCGTAKSEYSEPKRTITTPFEPCPVPKLKVETVGSTSIVVSWTPNVPFYEIAFREVGDAEWNELADNLNPPFIIEAFKPLSSYEIKMRGVCNDDQFSAYSDVIKFVTTSDETCDQPFLTSFATTPTSVTLDWSPAAPFFEIQYRPINGTNWLSVSGDTPPPFTLSGLLPNRTYNIRIRNNCKGQFSEFSDVFQISTPPIPNSCPIPFVTVSEITLTTAEVNWTPSERIFEVTYRPVGSSNWQRIIRNTPPPAILTNLLEGTEYEIRVRNYCNTGANGISGFSEYSRTETFLTQFPDPICETPTISITNVETNNFTVQVSPTEANIEIHVRKRDSGDNWSIYYTHNQTSFKIENLLINTEYEVKARRFCGQIFSDFTAEKFVLTKTPTSPPCNRATLTVVPNTVDETRATLSWKNGTLTVEITYKTNEETSWHTIRTTKVSPFTLTELQPCKMYEARIRNFCNGEFSDYSTVSFQTSCPPPPSCDAPMISINAVTPNSVSVSWANADVVDTYEYSYRIKGGTWVTNYDRQRPPFIIRSLEPEKEYEIRFRQYCNPDFSFYSDVLTFTTPAVPIQCHAPTDVSVSGITPRSATVKWKAPEGVRSFRILYFTPNFLARTTAIVNNDYVLLTNLRPGSPYQFQVKALCNDGSESVYTSTVTFNTPSPKEGVDLNNENLTLSLYPNPNRGQFTIILENTTGTTALQLFDLNGKKIWATTSQNETMIPITLDQISAGIYLLSARTENGLEKRIKVVIE